MISKEQKDEIMLLATCWGGTMGDFMQAKHIGSKQQVKEAYEDVSSAGTALLKYLERLIVQD